MTMDDKDREEGWVRAQLLREMAAEENAAGRAGVARALLAGAVALEALAKTPPKAPPRVLAEAWAVVDEDGKLVVEQGTCGPQLFVGENADLGAGLEAGPDERAVRVRVVEVTS